MTSSAVRGSFGAGSLPSQPARPYAQTRVSAARAPVKAAPLPPKSEIPAPSGCPASRTTVGLPSPQQVRLSRRPPSSTSYKPSIVGLASGSGADDAVVCAVVVPVESVVVTVASVVGVVPPGYVKAAGETRASGEVEVGTVGPFSCRGLPRAGRGPAARAGRRWPAGPPRRPGHPRRSRPERRH